MTETELATQKMLTSLMSQITALEAKLDSIKQTVDRSDKALYGNGTQGLIDRIARIETKMWFIGSVTGFAVYGLVEALKHVI